jgi:hypothetical protein
MKNAHINSKAAAGGQVRATSFVRRLLACALIGGAAMSVAHAGPGRGQQQAQERPEYSRDNDPRQQQQQQPRQYDDRQQRQFDERASQARAEEQRRQFEQQQQANDGRRNGRMTADERRDLRRQINEAGADIYPNNGRRR